MPFFQFKTALVLFIAVDTNYFVPTALDANNEIYYLPIYSPYRDFQKTILPKKLNTASNYICCFLNVQDPPSVTIDFAAVNFYFGCCIAQNVTSSKSID